MKARSVAAVIAGATAEVVTVAVLWAFTKMELCRVALLAMLAFVAASGLAAWAAGKWKLVPRETAKKKGGGPQIFNLRDYPEWREKDVRMRRG